MRGNTRLMTGFWYKERKCIRKSQLIDLAFRGGMCLTQFVFEAAEKGVFTTLDYLMRNEGESWVPVPPYEIADESG